MESRQPLIALVDDDKVFQLIASRSIKAAKFNGKLLQFNNGGEAMQYLEEHATEELLLPDVLFLDINMPVVDGWMFLEDFIHFKPRIKKAIKIYMVSSSIDPKDIERAMSFEEVREYVTKPISQDKFAEIISLVPEN